jgi:hypothetical protein
VTEEKEGRFPAALAGVHTGDPRCPATGGKGGECSCSELKKEPKIDEKPA